MIILMQGESLQIPATVVGDKSLIQNLSAVIKKSTRGEVPPENAATVATLSYEDFVSDVISNGYLFYLTNTNALVTGTYYVNYEYTIAGRLYKGEPLKVVVKESVI